MCQINTILEFEVKKKLKTGNDTQLRTYLLKSLTVLFYSPKPNPISNMLALYHPESHQIVLIETSHLNAPDVFFSSRSMHIPFNPPLLSMKMSYFTMLEKVKRNVWISYLYIDLQQILMGSILGQGPSINQIWWKSIQ